MSTTDYCPLCNNAAAGILNVGRDHYAVCHDCRAYQYIGSNLFSAWRNEEPADWERNEKILAIYKNATAANTADSERHAQYMGYLESLPRNEVANAPTLNEYFGGQSERTAPHRTDQAKNITPAAGLAG